MLRSLTRLCCSGCAAEAAPDDPLPFRCPNAGGAGDVDHVLRRELVKGAEEAAVDWKEVFGSDEPNPFVRFRRLLHSFNFAQAHGVTDSEYVGVVRALDASIASVAGAGFCETPFRICAELNRALGRLSGSLLVKDETGNVSGSHKARHLAGIMLWLQIAERCNLVTGGAEAKRLAIASCGNAALAAAVVAKAARWPLDVFIPTDAHPIVTRQLEDLGARLTVCRRLPGTAGDPCIHGFREDLDRGALPFSVQGNENGLTLEGGLTLGWEIASALFREEARLDRLFIQTGGGALASSCAQALREAVRLGLIPSMPKIHAVQTKGGYPLRRAWELVVRHALEGVAPLHPETDEELAARLALPGMKEARQDALRYAATHRSEFMWPWESTPHSAAHGILDDETYDWIGVVEAMFETGGYPVVATEKDILEANEIGKRETGMAVEHTGTAGMAGLMRLLKAGAVGADESVGLLFTGRER